MCNSRITIYNNSDFVNLHSFDVKRSVPCGYCLSCQWSKQMEYALRCYYEWKESELDGGFTYWNSLTYRDDALPMAYDMPCFNKKDIQDYIKRIRKTLNDRYSISKDAFRYLVVAEYGGTNMRPHYHVLFFVHTPKISYRQFHSICWKQWYNYNGITDLKHGYNPEQLVIRNMAGMLYVCKYIRKDSFRLRGLYNVLNDNISEDFEEVPMSRINQLFGNWQIHSLGFGSYLLKCPDQEQYIKDLKCSMPVSDNPSKLVPLPMYYRRMRKDRECVLGLYDVYERVSPEIDPDTGKNKVKRFWKKSDKLIEYEIKHNKERFQSKITDLENKINGLEKVYNLCRSELPQSQYLPLANYVSRVKIFCGDFSLSLHGVVDSLLAGRNISDLGLYAVDRRGRFCDGFSETSVDVIISRGADIGFDVNPLKYADDPYQLRSMRSYYSDAVEHDRKFDKLLDLLDVIYNAYQKVSLRADEDLHNLKSKL